MSRQPTQSIMVTALKGSAQVLHPISQQSDDFCPVIVNRVTKKITDFTLNPELLTEFSCKTIFVCFISLNFSPGKFLVSGHVAAGFSSGGQYQTICFNDGGGDQ